MKTTINSNSDDVNSTSPGTWMTVDRRIGQASLFHHLRRSFNYLIRYWMSSSSVFLSFQLTYSFYHHSHIISLFNVFYMIFVSNLCLPSVKNQPCNKQGFSSTDPLKNIVQWEREPSIRSEWNDYTTYFVNFIHIYIINKLDLFAGEI